MEEPFEAGALAVNEPLTMHELEAICSCIRRGRPPNAIYFRTRPRPL